MWAGMKNKTPKTIADLKINWTFCKVEVDSWENFEVLSQFRKLNPDICDLVIKQDYYIITYKNEDYILHSLDKESLASFITYLNYLIWEDSSKDVKLKKFQRVSDTEYILYAS